MTIEEIIELFDTSMRNEIYNSPADDITKEYLIEALKDTSTLVLDTYNAKNK